MVETLRVRLYREGDESSIIPLLEAGFDGWPHFDLGCEPIEHWKWKFLSNPYKIMSIGVSEEKGRIVGVSHQIFQRLKFFDNIHLLTQGVDNSVSPDYRKRGLSKTMFDLTREEYTIRGAVFSNWSTGNKHLIDFALKHPELYHRYPFRFVHLVKIKDVGYHFRIRPSDNMWLKKIGYKTLSALKPMKKPVIEEEIKVSEINCFSDIFDDFWERIKDSYDYIVVRDREFLNWRYCDKRGGDYKILSATRDEELLGFIVLRTNRYDEGYHIGYIVDFLTDSDDAIGSLVDRSLDFFDSKGINMINYLGSRGGRNHLNLAKFGFYDSRQDFYQFYTNLVEGKELSKIESVDPYRIHFSYGDTDHI